MTPAQTQPPSTRSAVRPHAPARPLQPPPFLPPLRPLATAAVYFWDPQCRAELRDYRTLGRKLWHRLSGLAAWTCGRDDRRRGLRFNHELDEVRIIDDDNGTGSDSEHEAVGHGAMSGTRTSVRYELMED